MSFYDHQPHKILDDTYYVNGLVDVITPDPDYKKQFEMMERVNVANKSSAFREALAGVLEDNVLSRVFFSAENLQIIQNGIRAGVYKMSQNDIVVPQQNVVQLKNIMRSYYLQYAENFPKDITKEIERLNKMVLDYSINDVYNSAVSYQKYLRDISTLPTLFEAPKQIDREFQALEMSKRFI